MNKFDTETTALAALTKNKKPDCVTALTALFRTYRAKGTGIREAHYQAEIVHFLDDHDGNLHSPRPKFEENDQAAHQTIINLLMGSNSDGLAEERIDRVLYWYELVRTWGANVGLAFTTSVQISREEWDETHDMDEAEAIKTLEGLPAEDDDETFIKEATFKTFYSLRNEGNSVRYSLRAALDEAQKALEFAVLMSSLGNIH